MKKNVRSFIGQWALALTAVSLTQMAVARPYATSLTNDIGTISFRLNESADNVKVIWNGGATTNDLGPVPQGLTVTNLGVTGTYKVQVSKATGAGYLQGVVNQISVDTNTFVRFVNQRGVDVNKNTNSPYFGRIYVSVATGGTTAAPARTLTEGLYLLNADQTDAVGQGNTARTGGLFFDTGATPGSESPYRIFVGPDDNIYITDWSDSNGGLFVTDPNVATNAIATNVLFGVGGPSTATNIHGSIPSVYVEGSLANSDLVVYTQDEDLTPKNSVWRYDIGAGPLPYESAGSQAFTFGQVSQVAEILRAAGGKWYLSNRRADNATSAGIFVRSEDGTTALWNSLTAWRTLTGNNTNYDIYCSEIRGIAVSPDNKYLVGIKGNTNSVTILPLEDGIPNITNLIVMPTTPTTSIGRDITFDAAGNLYTVSSGQGVLRIYSPGGESTVITGSDGTFDVIVPEVNVSVTAVDAEAKEPGADTGEFTVTRATSNLSQPLTVRIQASGTATNGIDYVLKTNGVTLTTNLVVIPSGASDLAITVTPLDDSVAETTETVILTVVPNIGYTATSPTTATVLLLDDEPSTIDVSVVQATAYEQSLYDFVRFRLTRRGDTNATSFSVTFNFTGDAASGVDFTPPASVQFDPGVTTLTFDVNPIDDALLESPESLICSVAPSVDYTVGTGPATATLLDDDMPARPVLLTEDFTSADVATNWNVTVGNTNETVQDYTLNFGYDYSGSGIPSAPNSPIADTFGIYMTANKAGSASASAVNAYLTNVVLSGNYAVRFDMYLIRNTGCGSTTEYALFGINHDGTHTNWFRNSAGGIPATWTFDGLFYGVEADAAALGDYVLYSGPITTNNNPTPLTPGRNATTLTSVFKAPPFANAGAPANLTTTTTPSWVDVEISQIGKIVSLKMNNTTIFSYSNATPYTAGHLMLGYVDAYDSAGCDAGVIYDNLRVVTLPGLNITSIQPVGGNIQIDFSWGLNDAASQFRLQSATAVEGPYTDEATATISVLAPGTSYRAVIAAASGNRFYRIRHQ